MDVGVCVSIMFSYMFECVKWNPAVFFELCSTAGFCGVFFLAQFFLLLLFFYILHLKTVGSKLCGSQSVCVCVCVSG